MNDFEERLKKIEKRLEEIEKLFVQSPPQAVQTVKKISVKEFLLEKKPKSEIETTFWLGFFLEKNDAKSSFGVEELRNAFRSAKIPPPKNINDTVNKNVAKGLFMETKVKEKGQKRWEITATGETYEQ